MAPWLRIVLWIVAIVAPGGFALLPFLAGEHVKRRRDERSRALAASSVVKAGR